MGYANDIWGGIGGLAEGLWVFIHSFLSGGLLCPVFFLFKLFVWFVVVTVSDVDGDVDEEIKFACDGEVTVVVGSSWIIGVAICSVHFVFCYDGMGCVV